MAGALAPVQDGDDPQTGEVHSQHVLQLGEKSFMCGPRLPMGTFMKYSSSDSGDLTMYHHVITKLVVLRDGETIDDVWDACDEIEPEDMFKAIAALIESYSERPTKSPGHSSPGSGRTKRK